MNFFQQLVLTLIDKLVIGLLILLAGFWFNRMIEKYKNEAELRREIQALKDQTTIEYIEKQIRELYSPLLGLIQYSSVVHNIAYKKLEMDRDHYSETKDYFIEKYYLPINAQIANLIRDKIYLIESDEIMTCFIEYLSYQAQYESLYKLWVDKKIPSDGISPEPFPKDIEAKVHKSLDYLRKKHRFFLSKIVVNDPLSEKESYWSGDE